MTPPPPVPGQWVKHPAGYRYFVPAPLPPDITLDAALYHATSDADRLIGRLAGEGRQLPNPHLLIRPFIRREAVYSSRIEGTQATLGELLAAEAGAAVQRSPDDLREVGNYVVALERGIRMLRHPLPRPRLIRELHRILMTGVRGDEAMPGSFRDSQNWIGGMGGTVSTAAYVPPAPYEMRESLKAWYAFWKYRALPPLIQIALLHYQFEAIHPFLDGNGRVGRLLITLFLIEREILPSPLLYLSAFIEATRRDYYDALRGVTERGDWATWLHYFLNGVSRQSEDALSRAERIGRLITHWRLAVAGSPSKITRHLVERVAVNPFLTLGDTAERLSLSFPSVQRAVDRLVRLKILHEVSGSKRNRVYCAKALLSILEEPARLTPAAEN